MPYQFRPARLEDGTYQVTVKELEYLLDTIAKHLSGTNDPELLSIYMELLHIHDNESEYTCGTE